MQSSRVMSYLRELCCDIDEGRQPRRFEWRRAVGTIAIPLAIGLASVAPGCAREDCGDGVDNDGDAKVDCSDPDCIDLCGFNAEYAAPFPHDVDTLPNAEYAAPFPYDPEPPKPPIGFDQEALQPVPAYAVQDFGSSDESVQDHPVPAPRYMAPLPDSVRRYGAPFPG